MPATVLGQNVVGTTAASFLELGVGGRAVGMGGAYTAVADDASALYWNPAGLTNVEHRAAIFMHATYLDSSFFDYGAYAQNLGVSSGAFGAAFQYLNAGQITQTGSTFNQTGTYTPYDLALSLGYARKLGGASLGLDAKYIRSAVINTAQTAAADLGVLSPEYFDRRLRLGAAVLNLGGTLKYQQTAENLPLTVKAGAAYHPAKEWLVSMDVAKPRGGDAYFAAGTEYQFPVMSVWTLAGRAGYSSQTLDSVSGVTGLSIGGGIASRGLSFDYAFVPYGGVGVTNRFSVSARW